MEMSKMNLNQTSLHDLDEGNQIIFPMAFIENHPATHGQ
jgi:hypothetical protein